MSKVGTKEKRNSLTVQNKLKIGRKKKEIVLKTKGLFLVAF